MNLENIKQIIQSIIEERDELAFSQPEITPSEYWRFFSARTKYLMDLSEESLRYIRYHTYHITTDIYLRYALGNPDVLLQNGALNLDTWLGESEPDNGIGFDYYSKGKICKISTDLINYDTYIKLMNDNGALWFSKTLQKGEVDIVEIGAGYGGLAYNLIWWLRRHTKVRYYIIDLPEILLFSAIYFTVNSPELKMYLYNPGDSVPDSFDDYDIILLPNYRADLLKTLSRSRLKLIINIASFQEMTPRQVKDYLELSREILAPDGCLFSWNLDRNPGNKEMDLDVSDLLSQYFTLSPVDIPVAKKKFSLQEQTARILRAAALFVKLMPPAPEPFYPVQVYKGYVCRK